MPSVPLISIVDDDEALRSSLEDLIRSAGFRVQSFSSAEAFLTSNQVQTTDCLMRSMQHCGMDKNEDSRHRATYLVSLGSQPAGKPRWALESSSRVTTVRML